MEFDFEKFNREWSERIRQEQRFEFTDKHLALMRLMCVVWDAGEFGAPILWPLQPPGAIEKMLTLLDLILNPEEIDFDSPEFEAFKHEIGKAFEVFLHNAVLVPGNYTYHNPLVEFEEESWLLNSYDERTLPINKDAEVHVTFEERHRKLIKYANGGWLDYYQCPGINSKRPYGDRTDFKLDMAEILGMVFSRDGDGTPVIDAQAEAALAKIHYEEMLMALQVFLCNATIETGTYRQIPAAMRFWERVAT